MTMDVSVLVVDDAPAFRVAAAAVLSRTPGFTLAGEAATGEQAVTAAASLHPRLVLMDMRLPGISGVEATRRIVEADPTTVVILCSTYQRSDLPDDVGSSGAAAYMHKEELAPANIRRLWDEATGGVTPSAAPAPA
jgi:DNA-binding NarL/FixJ family response regulator